MELRTVFCQIFVIFFRIADTGVQVQDALLLQRCLQCLIKPAAKTILPGFRIQIDRHLRRPVICCASHERPGICVSCDHTIRKDTEIRITLQCFSYPPSEFFQRWRLIFKRDRRLFPIIRIDFQQPRCICLRDCTYQYRFHPVALRSDFSCFF